MEEWGFILSLIGCLLSAARGTNSCDVLVQQSNQEAYSFPIGFSKQRLPRRALLGRMNEYELSDSLSDY